METSQERATRMMKMVEVGGVFTESYGWEMTGFIFYQIVGKTTKKVKVRRINAIWDGDTVKPNKDDFYDDVVFNKTVKFCSSEPMITMGYSNAYMSTWDCEHKTTER